MSLIYEMLHKVEEEHQVKLEQLNSIKSQQNTLFNAVSNKVSPSQSMDAFMTSPDNINSLNSKTTSLSLEDKERIAKQNEQHERLKSQTSLVPQQQVKRVESTQPRDLTSTLIGANLAGFTQNHVQNKSVFPTLSASQNDSSSQSFQAFQSYEPLKPVHVPFQPQSTSIINPIPIQPSTHSSRTKPTNVFDQIVIPDLKNQTRSSSTPMNQLKTSNTMTSSIPAPILLPSAPSINLTSQTKPLSKSDLDDFLK